MEAVAWLGRDALMGRDPVTAHVKGSSKGSRLLLKVTGLRAVTWGRHGAVGCEPWPGSCDVNHGGICEVKWGCDVTAHM
jgi:hypothetical protein